MVSAHCPASDPHDERPDADAPRSQHDGDRCQHDDPAELDDDPQVLAERALQRRCRHDLQRGVDEHAQAQHPDDDRGVGSRGDVGDHRGEGERHGVDADPSDKAERSCRRGDVGEPARPADQTLDDPEVVNRQQDEEHTERDRVGAELVWRQQPGEHQPEAELAGASEELGDQAPPQRRARGGTTATGRIWSLDRQDSICESATMTSRRSAVVGGGASTRRSVAAVPPTGGTANAISSVPLYGTLRLDQPSQCSADTHEDGDEARGHRVGEEVERRRVDDDQCAQPDAGLADGPRHRVIARSPQEPAETRRRE